MRPLKSIAGIPLLPSSMRKFGQISVSVMRKALGLTREIVLFTTHG